MLGDKFKSSSISLFLNWQLMTDYVNRQGSKAARGHWSGGRNYRLAYSSRKPALTTSHLAISGPYLYELWKYIATK